MADRSHPLSQLAAHHSRQMRMFTVLRAVWSTAAAAPALFASVSGEVTCSGDGVFPVTV